MQGYFSPQNIKTPCPELLTHLWMGLWSEYFLKTPPVDSNVCPLSTPVVESWLSNSCPQSWDSARRIQVLVRRNLGAMRVCVFGEPTCIVYALFGYLHGCVKHISKCRRTFAAKSKVALALRQSPHSVTPRFDCNFFSLTILKPVLKH